MRRALAAGLFALLLTDMAVATPSAAPRVLELDAARSTIRFQLRAMGWIAIRGTAVASGEVRVRGKSADIDVQVALATLRMGRDGWRDWALSEEFFDAQAHPQLAFTARKVPMARLRDGGELAGKLNVRGQSRPAQFTLQRGDCDDAATRCRVQAVGELSRRAFGMRSRRYTLGDRIQIDLDLRLAAKP
jgi:polyisoprenoid-binding protein YceI